jgi:uncharacterized phage protein gp47/JayE
MSNIIKTYTADQIYEMAKNLILSQNVGITDFNDGGKTKAILQMIADLTSTISMDFKEGLYKAIPVALYDGFGFNRKAAVASSGYIRPYRLPAMVLHYTGVGTSALVTVTATSISATCVGAPGDAFSFNFSSYTKTSDLETVIDALTNWSCSAIKDVDSDTLYIQSSSEVVGSFDYLNTAGLDLMLQSDIAISIPEGFSVSIDDMQFLTTADATILAGKSGVQCPATNTTTGIIGNIAVNGIDTINGKGYINSTIAGVYGVINDSVFTGGTEAETDSERATRFSNTVNALNAGTKEGILAAISSITGVRSVGMRTSYPYRGTNTIVVDSGSGSISASLLAEIEKVLYGDPDDLINYPGKNAEGIGYIISTPTIVDVSIGITIYRLPTVNVSLDEIKIDVKTAVEQYINTAQLGQDILLSEIIRVGKNSNLAVYDMIINSPGANISINENEFARTGAGTGGTVTVTAAVTLVV